jgi:spermidine synthase
MEEDDPNNWFCDTINADFVQQHRLLETVYSGKTGFQSVEIIRTSAFGKCLVLDKKIQSSEMDEFIYHEALVHPSMILHRRPSTVFIAGGGEGATLREVLRHRSVEKVVMVDIDQEAVELCRRFLPSMHQGAFDDSRVELLYLDAREYLANSNQKFDVILIDLTDPLEGSVSCRLYTQEFYQLVQSRLSPGGIMAVQSGSCTLGDLNMFATIHSTLQSVFPAVFPYQAYIPSFGGLWGFNLCSQQQDPLLLSVEEVDKHISDSGCKSLKFYDGLTHRSMFSLPRYLRQELNRGRAIITDKNPLLTH